MNIDLSALPWLPKTPENFRKLCREISARDENCAEMLISLSKYSLSENQLSILARTIIELRKSIGGNIPKLQPFTLGLISNATTKLISPSIVASAIRYGIDLHIVEAEFDQVMQIASGFDTSVVDANPNAILLALDYHGYKELLHRTMGNTDDALGYLETIRSGLREQYKGTLIFQTIPAPPESLFGNLDSTLRHTQRSRIEEFNYKLAGNFLDASDLLFDVVGIANNLGCQNWFDNTQWHLAKLPFAQRYVPFYADNCSRLVAALVGKSRKCLVLDLDNTIWGGVVGDDGMDNLELGQGSALGESFLAVQQMALDLRERGIIIAVSSKNDDSVARAVFQKHPDMLLREEHITVFQANWSDKASNLEAISEKLNIGIDSLVFVDDNPAEREQVRQVLPQVAVPEIGDDPANYPRLVMSAGYFEAISFLDEDRQRIGQYEANAKRASLQGQSRDLKSYLKSLKMLMTISPFEQIGRKRIAQLINKSNQFNLTVRRYTEAEIEQMENNSDIITFQIRLEDCFGDNGVISIVIARRNGSLWDIDTWLMSCRVLGRGVEIAVLNELARAVVDKGGTHLRGVYCPTDRNKMVAEHYKKLGFEFFEEGNDKHTSWSLELLEFKPAVAYISCRSSDLI